MVDRNKIRRLDLERNGLQLSYLNSDGCDYVVSICVDDIYCVYIRIGNLFDDYLRFSIIHNYGCSAGECIEYIKKRITPDSIPPTYCVEIYKELLDVDFVIRLQSCINNIPENLVLAEQKIIEEARKKCDEKVKAAYEAAQKEFTGTLLATAHARRNAEQVDRNFTPPKKKELVYRQMIPDKSN